MSHLGRPNGLPDSRFSLEPVYKHLKQNLATEVLFANDCVSEEAIDMANNLRQGQILLLENLRFHSEEEGKFKNPETGKSEKVDKERVDVFRQKLSQMGDFFVNDAFGTSHRAHSSIIGTSHKTRASGLLLEKEIKVRATNSQYLGGILENPRRPLTVVMGGAKVSDKLPIIRNLLPLADNLIITGGMIFTFLKAIREVEIGYSLFEKGQSDYIRQVLQEAKARNVNIFFPTDFKSTPFADFEAYVEKRGAMDKPPLTTTVDQGIPSDHIGLDIGPESVAKFNEVLLQSECVALNGPSGLTEHPLYRQGTVDLFNQIADLTSQRESFISVIGGGDSVNAIRFCKEDAQFSHVSTGGGAFLELLEGKRLPGIHWLSDRN